MGRMNALLVAALGLCMWGVGAQNLPPMGACISLSPYYGPVPALSIPTYLKNRNNKLRLSTPETLDRAYLTTSLQISSALDECREEDAITIISVRGTQPDTLYLTALPSGGLSFTTYSSLASPESACWVISPHVADGDDPNVITLSNSADSRVLGVAGGVPVMVDLTSPRGDNQTSLVAWSRCTLLPRQDLEPRSLLSTTCLLPAQDEECVLCPPSMRKSSNGTCEMMGLASMFEVILAAQQSQITLNPENTLVSMKNLASLCASLTWPFSKGRYGGISDYPNTDFVTQRIEAGDSQADQFGFVRDITCTLSRSAEVGAGPALLPLEKTVFNPVAQADLNRLIRQQLDILRTMDSEMCQWQKEQNLAIRASQVWERYNNNTLGFSTYTTALAKEQSDILAAYGQVILTLNSNITMVYSKINDHVDAAVAQIESMVKDLENQLSSITTREQYFGYAKMALQVINMGVGMYLGMQSGAGGAEDSAADAAAGAASDAAASAAEGESSGISGKDMKKVADALNVLEGMVMFIWAGSSGIENRNPCQTNCIPIVDIMDSLKLQFEMVSAVQAMSSMFGSLTRQVLTDPTQLPSVLPSIAMDLVTAGNLDNSVKALSLTLAHSPTDSSVVAVSADSQLFTSLVRARVDAFKGWYDAAISLKELKSSEMLLNAQHRHVQTLITDELSGAMLSTQALVLMSQRRNALVAVVQRNIDLQLVQVSFTHSLSRSLDEFTSAVSLASEELPSLASIPSTPEIALRHLEYLNLALEASTDLFQITDSLSDNKNAGALTSTRSAMSNFDHTTCWTAVLRPREDSNEDKFHAFLNQSQPFVVQVNPAFSLSGQIDSLDDLDFTSHDEVDVPYWDVKVRDVRAYLVFRDGFEIGAGRIDAQSKQVHMLVSHHGSSLMVLNNTGAYERVFHNTLDYPLIYDASSMCPLAESSHNNLVSPSPFAIWHVKLMSPLDERARSMVTSIRLELMVTSRARSGTHEAMYANANLDQHVCVMPSSLKKLQETHESSENFPGYVIAVAAANAAALLALVVLTVFFKNYRVQKKKEADEYVRLRSSSSVAPGDGRSMSFARSVASGRSGSGVSGRPRRSNSSAVCP